MNIWLSILIKLLLAISYPFWFFLFPFFEEVEKNSVKKGFGSIFRKKEVEQ